MSIKFMKLTFVGLSKLAITEAEVKEMQIILINMKPELDKATVATAEMIDKITKNTVSLFSQER